MQVEGHSIKELACTFQKCQHHESIKERLKSYFRLWNERDVRSKCNAWFWIKSSDYQKKKLTMKDSIETIGEIWNMDQMLDQYFVMSTEKNT